MGMGSGVGMGEGFQGPGYEAGLADGAEAASCMLRMWTGGWW